MKEVKVGLLFGRNSDFVFGLIREINSRNKNIVAEPIQIDVIIQSQPIEYDIIIDMISYKIPLYQSLIKNISLTRTKTINNSHLLNFQDHFYLNSLCAINNITVPKTVLLPSKLHPSGIISSDLTNLNYPLDWNYIFDYTGFPALLKNNLKLLNVNSLIVNDEKDFFAKYDNSGSNVMVLQEFLEYENYVTAYFIGDNIFSSNLVREEITNQFDKIENIVKKIVKLLELDFGSISFGILEDKIYLVDLIPTVDSIDVENYPEFMDVFYQMLLSKIG